MTDNASIARDTYDAWNERDFDRFAEPMRDAKLIVMGTGEHFDGLEGALRFAHSWADGFPDGRIEVENLVDAGDQIIVEFTGRGTHAGTLATSAGEIPATGRPVELHICDVWRFADGRVESVHTYFDTGSLMAQLGLMPEAAAATA